MYITKLLTLSIMISSLLLTFGILFNPTITFSQQGQDSEVIITLGAADEGNFEPYTPRAINVMPGSIVSWTNEDMTPHTVTADNNLFDTGLYLQATHLKMYLIRQENWVITVQYIRG